ncbi:MAG: hypothetical protein LBJ00_07385 [Planctomycetaceae bacterium]|nr:hypothetical protein [Planctomycetaceae bacterium]
MFKGEACRPYRLRYNSHLARLPNSKTRAIQIAPLNRHKIFSQIIFFVPQFIL